MHKYQRITYAKFVQNTAKPLLWPLVFSSQPAEMTVNTGGLTLLAIFLSTVYNLPSEATCV